MITPIKNKIANLRRNLSSLDNQPVGNAALIILLFLDLFILISIFDGLDDHTRQLTQPDQLIPQYCRDIVIEGEWNETIRLKRLAEVVSKSRGRYFRPDERERTLERHSVCAPIARLFLSIEDDEGLSSNLKDFLKVHQQTRQLDSELSRVKGAYDTSLLETIADQSEGKANVDALREEITLKTTTVDDLVQKKKLHEASLEQDKRIRELYAYVDRITEAERTSLKNDLRDLNFWYPVKRLGMEMIFLIPLFLMFYLWNNRSISRNRPFQKLVSSHLMVVVFIPVLIKIIELIYDIVPKKLLKRVIDLLESLNLVAIWHYLLMAVVILGALALIYIFQKKLFSHEKTIEKRISKGECQHCGKRLPPNAAACPFCGFEQFKQCGKCNKLTYVYGRYCRECGHGD